MSTIRDTVWFCTRCKRALVNDRSRAAPQEDTVTCDQLTGRVVHDQCAGLVEPSSRKRKEA